MIDVFEKRRLSVYISGSYSNVREIGKIAEHFTGCGLIVTSTWINPNNCSDEIEGNGDEDEEINTKRRVLANTDISDINRANWFVLIADNGGSKGGKHFELGYAYGRRKHNIIVVGKPENIFQHLDRIRVVDTVESAIGAIFMINKRDEQ